MKDEENKNAKYIKWGAIGGGLLLLFIIVRMALGAYDTAISLQEGVKEKIGNVEASYQRRADLIPNLVSTVKGYAGHEKGTLTAVIEARAKATGVTINGNNFNAASLRKFQQAQSGLTSALSKLMVVAERYPDLKANQNFMSLQSQLEGTENRINVARQKFNGSVKDYNSHIKKFLNKKVFLNIMADDDEFEVYDAFEAKEASKDAPEVSFE